MLHRTIMCNVLDFELSCRFLVCLMLRLTVIMDVTDVYGTFCYASIYIIGLSFGPQDEKLL